MVIKCFGFLSLHFLGFSKDCTADANIILKSLQYMITCLSMFFYTRPVRHTLDILIPDIRLTGVQPEWVTKVSLRGRPSGQTASKFQSGMVFFFFIVVTSRNDSMPQESNMPFSERKQPFLKRLMERITSKKQSKD